MPTVQAKLDVAIAQVKDAVEGLKAQGIDLRAGLGRRHRKLLFRKQFRCLQ